MIRIAALDHLVGLVIDRLVSMAENEVNLHLNSKKQAKILASNLQSIKEVLEDAEKKQLDSPSIKRWLEEIQGLAYDIDDALDVLEIMNNKKSIKLEMDPNDAVTFIWKKVISSLCSFVTCFKQVVEYRQIALNVQDLNTKTNEMYVKAENELRLHRAVGEGKSRRGFNKDRKLENSVVFESWVHGRDKDKEILSSMLLNDYSNAGQVVGLEKVNIPIVAIVGVGGIGKTTLAKLVYKSFAETQFSQKIWVSVSDPFNEIRIAKAILEALEGQAPNVNEMESLMRRIRDNIKVKGKFFLVLDDVWTDDCNVWEPFIDCLSYGVEGSKILITTRNEQVAEVIGASKIHRLSSLTDEESWSIISQLAFLNQSGIDRQSLEGFGREIAKKCGGLPLAARFLGNLLRSKHTVQHWQYVLHSEFWKLKNVENHVFGILFLSYNELEPEVKRCFAYCAVFPKDTRLYVEKLVRMWMVQGFISSSARAGEVELEARDYFLELAQRGFFQDFGEDYLRNKERYCKMHDIVHDFAQYLSNSDCAVVRKPHDINAKSETDNEVSYDDCRHVWLEAHENTLYSGFNAKKLRSLIWSSSVITPSMLRRLKHIRVLSLARCELDKIPNEIGYLLCLRYLDLSENNMSKLPDSICKLINLQTLDLLNCRNLCTLPQGIYKLINLRHLYVTIVLEYPAGLQRLVNLRTLSYFRASRGYHLRYLKDLNRLGGRLEIYLHGLNEESDVEEATKAELAEKISLETLYLEYRDVKSEVLEVLQPPSMLRYLRCGGDIYPNWISSLTYLRRLELCGNCSATGFEASFPPLWKMGFLEELSINFIYRLKRLGREFLGLATTHVNSNDQQELVAFQRLQKLSFYGCKNWEEWEDISEEEGPIKIMPHLHELEISRCDKLEKLPHHLLLHVSSSLQYLSISGCKKLKELYQHGQENRGKISHIPHLYV